LPHNVRRAAAWSVAFVMGIWLAGCSLLPKEEAPLDPPLVKPVQENYTTVKVERGTVSQEINATASFESVHTFVAQFTAGGGRIEQMLVHAGDKVKKGDKLVQLAMDGLDIQLKEQELALEKAKYAWMQARSGGGDDEAVKIALLQMQLEQLKYDRLEKQYNSKILTSGIDGEVVFTEDLKPGDAVDAYQTLVTVADPTQLRLAMRVESAGTLQDVEVGFPATVTVRSDGSEETVEGRVVQTPSSAPQTLNKDLADKYSKTLYIQLPKLPKGARIGGSADVKIVVQKRDNVLKIPKSGLRSYLGRNFVRLLEEGNKIREVDVEPGLQSSTEVEIVQGLKEGDVVVQQ